MNAEKLLKFIGSSTTTAGLALQGVAIGGSGRAHLVVQICAISCSAIGAGCLAVTSPVIMGGRAPTGKTIPPPEAP